MAKIFLTFLLAAGTGLPARAAEGAKFPGEAKASPKKQTVKVNEEQKVLYALGVVLGRNVAGFALKDEEMKFVLAGLHDGIRNKKLQLDMATYGPRIHEMQLARQSAAARIEKDKSKAFLEKASKEKGAQTSPFGLIYTEVQAGTGASPTAADTVRVHFKGALMDGTIFDDSIKRGKPAEFSLGAVIPCWKEGIAKMKVGGKAKFVCQSSSGYGDEGKPPYIPPGATLVYDVELIEISAKK